jgi:hypothetical protein
VAGLTRLSLVLRGLHPAWHRARQIGIDRTQWPSSYNSNRQGHDRHAGSPVGPREETASVMDAEQARGQL